MHHHFPCLDFIPLHEVDCQDCHVARKFQHGNHGKWVLVWFEEGEHFGVSLIICNANVLLFNSDLMLYFIFGLI